MRIFITGAGGFVGARLWREWQQRHELHGFEKGFLARADEEQVRQSILRVQPDAIIHTAAQDLPTITVSAGRIGRQVELNANDLAKLIDAQFADITR